MAEKKRSRAYGLIRALSMGARFLTIAAITTFFGSIFFHPAFLASLFCGGAAALCILFAGVLIFFYEVQYSLGTLLIYFFIANTAIVCIVMGNQVVICLGTAALLALGVFVGISIYSSNPLLAAAAHPKHVKTRTGGVVKRILVKPGDTVTPGQELMVLATLEREWAIGADYTATIESISVRTDQIVPAGAVLGVLNTK